MTSRVPSRTIKHVRFYVAFSIYVGYRIIDQDDKFSTWIDRLSAHEAMKLCKMLNDFGSVQQAGGEIITP